jgi:hypothetical protein
MGFREKKFVAVQKSVVAQKFVAVSQKKSGVL